MSDRAPVLVTGATGQQGGATARALLAAGVPVRALIRNPAAAKAAEVAALGAELVTGDLRDPASLVPAARGARAVFSVQMPELRGDTWDFESELAQGVNLIEAALAAEVPQFVHTSVSGAGRHEDAPGWTDGRWAAMERVFLPKAGMQERVRAAGFDRWTLIKPGFFMENFLPDLAYLLPRGIAGGLATVLRPQTHLSLVAVDDIGRAAAAAVADPDRFHRVELELAGDHLPMTEIAKIIGESLGIDGTAPDMTEAEALAAGMPPWATTSHEFLNVAGQPARPGFARALGIPLTPFAEWADRHLRPLRQG
ncbi:NmrA family NAD(P)-binding protein [Micromonospora chalcea]|uniref:NmrA family NAD(P)-binding protein n=1 Tax=Micromonospora chalcea TaxID=1874 RepID=UPI003D723FFE